MLDLDFVRGQFPAFSEPDLQGWAFFENAGGSYACAPVIERLNRYYRQTKLQPYGPSPASTRAGREMDQAYQRLADYLNVGADEVHLGPSTSQNTYVLAQAVRGMLQAGDEIIVSNQDHEANSGVWRRLAKIGVSVREWTIDPQTGLLAPSDLDALLSDKTRLVAFPHCSNVIGTFNPVSEISHRIHSAQPQANVVVDGVAAAPHGLPDIESLAVDVYLFSLYKTYGPHQGLMYIRRELMDQLENQGHYFNDRQVRKRLLPAGPDHAQIAAAGGIADYLDALFQHHFPGETCHPAERGRRLRMLIQDHENRLLQDLLHWLRTRDDIRVIGPVDATGRAPTVSMLPSSRSVTELLTTLTDQRIIAGAGHFYAARVLKAMKIAPDPGVLRVSFLHYTSPVEMEQLINALDVALS